MSKAIDIPDIQNQIYNSVISGSYDNALKLSRLLVRKGQSAALSDVVTRLLNNGTPNSVSYAYRLWIADERNLVITYFPHEFKLIFSGDNVSITDSTMGYPLKLSDVQEQDGDRKVYGDGRKLVKEAMKWTFYPVWDNNAVYFKILNEMYTQWLKLVMKVEDRGDRRAFGCIEDETNRHQWYLRPAMNEGKLLFYIFNRKYDMALYLGEWLAPNNDRIAWGYNGRALGQPGVYGWKIEQYRT